MDELENSDHINQIFSNQDNLIIMTEILIDMIRIFWFIHYIKQKFFLVVSTQ